MPALSAATANGPDRRRRDFWLASLLAVFVLPAWGGAVTALAASDRIDAAAADPAEQIAQAIRGMEIGSSKVALFAVDLDSGLVLAEQRADEPMIPASNMKLLTSGGALVILGPDFAFETSLIRDGNRLIVRGAGDPAFGDPELLRDMGLDVEGLVDAWVRDVVEAGLTEISELVVDDRVFDDEFVHPTWPAGQLSRGYCAQVAGLNFFGNLLGVSARPASTEGSPPSFRLVPDVSRWLDFTNRAKTTFQPKRNNTLWVARAAGTNQMTLYGDIRFRQDDPIYVTVHDPAAFFARVFADRLRAGGVGVGTSRSAESQDPAWAGAAIGRPIRTPMATVLVRCNRDSENLFAEALLKRLGHEVTGQPGSWANGAAAMRMVLSKRLGPTLATQTSFVDGSGLSRGDRASPHVLAAWLGEMYRDERLREPFVNSLAQAGVDGTLRNRFDSIKVTGEVRAKSGYIDGVCCLSGYIIAPSSRAVAFSIMVNEIPDGIPVPRVKSLQERIVAVLDKYLMEHEPAVADGEVEKARSPRLGG